MRADPPLLQNCATTSSAVSRPAIFDTARNVVNDDATQTQQTVITRPKFETVFDSRNRKVRGLWKRGERYYAQLRVDVGNGRSVPRRLPLAAVDLTTARAELERKRTERLENRLRLPGRRPTFESFAREYYSSPAFTQKKPRTQYSQRQAIERWIKHIGALSLEKISLKMVDNYRRIRLSEKRRSTGKPVSARTVNLDVIALRQVLSYAKLCGHVDNIMQFFSPRHGGGLKALPHRPVPKRQLLTKEQFEALIGAAADETIRNSAELRFYLRFLALTGAREQEALCVARRDVNFERRFVTVGADCASKNNRSRAVDFSPELETLLKELEAWLPPDTSWLFPSPQRGSSDVHAKTLRESLKLVRKTAALEWVGFHTMRHFFASQCVMTGIDFMTTAQWLGHQDGGILVGKCYGHLADHHKQEAARKLRFFK